MRFAPAPPACRRPALSGRLGTGWRPGLAVFVAGLLLYGLSIQTRPAHLDEFYHLLAGRSWAQHGTFALLDGQYRRARLFTMLVGTAFDLTGRADLLTARLPSVLCVAAALSLLFVWVRRIVGPRDGTAAGLCAVALLGLSGYTLDIAHFARFYAPHMLLTLTAAMTLCAATRPDARHPAPALLGTVVALLLAAHLQPTTFIAALALLVWLVIDQRRRLQRLPAPVLAFTVLILMAAALAAPRLPLLDTLATYFRHTERWAEATRDAPFFYLQEMLRQIPVLTTLFPGAAYLAWRRYPAAGSLATIMVIVPLALHSFAGMKAWRYIYYIAPFIALVWALALSSLVERIRRAYPQRHSATLLALACAGLMAASPTYRHAAHQVSDSAKTLIATPTALAAPVPDGAWSRAAPTLRRLADEPGVLITGDDLRALTYIGRFDLFVSHSRLGELTPPADFTHDFRTGRPLADSPGALRAVIDCTPRGIALISDAQWRNPMGVRPRLAELIEHRLQPGRPTIPGFHLFRWNHRPTRPCPAGFAARLSSRSLSPEGIL